LFEVEVLGIAVAASVPLGKWKAYHARYLGLAGRRFSHERNANIIDPGSIYLAVLSYIYNAFFLGAVAYFVSVLGAHAFTNAPTETGLDALRIYVFSSFVLGANSRIYGNDAGVSSGKDLVPNRLRLGRPVQSTNLLTDY
jgi:hypothetical protein